MIDVNVSLSRWPFRRLPLDHPEKLVAKLRASGVTEAWAGNFDALLHRDLAAVNARTVAICRRRGDGLLRPFGAVDPTLPDWREDLRRCHEDYAMPGVRLHPNYHGYALDHPAFVELLDDAGCRGLVVQIALKMDDERHLHPLLKGLPTTDLAPLLPLLARPNRPKIILLNALRNLSGEPLRKLLAAGDVWVDVAMLEGIEGIKRLVAQVGPDGILFGTHAPFYYPEAAGMKLRESPLSPEQAEAVMQGNARRIIPAS